MREFVGKTEILFTLKTKDPAEAKVRHTQALAQVDAHWRSLRLPSQELTEASAHALAVAADLFARYRECPSQQTFWDVETGADLFTPWPIWPVAADIGPSMLADFKADYMKLNCRQFAESIAVRQGLMLTDDGRRALTVAVGHAFQRGALDLGRLARGEHVVGSITNAPASVGASTCKLSDLLAGWNAETKPSARTLYVWTGIERLRGSCRP